LNYRHFLCWHGFCNSLDAIGAASGLGETLTRFEEGAGSMRIFLA